MSRLKKSKPAHLTLRTESPHHPLNHSQPNSTQPSPSASPIPIHHLLPPPPPETAVATIKDRTQVATDRHNNHWQRQTKLVLNCCDHDTDPLLDPTKDRPQNGCHIWIRNAPLKRCPPTVGGHIMGGLKGPAKVAPDLGPLFKASRFKFIRDCPCM